MFDDAELYARATRTLLASWTEYARGVDGAFVHDGTAVFPHEPERSVYNNAVLGDVAAAEAAYARAGVDRFALWVRERETTLRARLEARGYRVDMTTRAMGMSLDAPAPPRSALDLVTPTWEEYLDAAELPPGLLTTSRRDGLRVLVARLDGKPAASILTFDHEGDCGVYNVGTREPARRRGLATALTAHALHEAAARGCTTASLQATAMAERVYARAGFRDLGRIIEYAPA